jgi:hypothetical protein
VAREGGDPHAACVDRDSPPYGRGDDLPIIPCMKMAFRLSRLTPRHINVTSARLAEQFCVGAAAAIDMNERGSFGSTV